MSREENNIDEIKNTPAQLPRFTDPEYFAKRPWTEYVFIVAICSCQLITQSGTTDVLTHMYQLQDSFNDSNAKIPWYLASFGMAVGTLIIFSGRVGDAYGLKRVLLGGYIWTVIWSILCGISYYDRGAGSNFYIAARAFQGAGVAFILPNAIGIVGRVYTTGILRKKIIFGCIGFCAPLGGTLGTVFSGVIAVRTGRWDWNYYAYAIFSLVIAILLFASVPHVPVTYAEDGKRQSIDLIGGILVTGSLVLFNFVWNEAAVVGWQQPYIIVLLIISIPMFIAFVFWELKFAKNPLIPAEVLSHGKVMAVLFILFLGWGAFGINIFHYATLMQQFRHESAFATGIAMTPAVITGFCAAISCALLMSPKTVELIMFGSMCCFLGSSFVLGFAGIDESYWRNTFGLWIIAPFGMDWSFPAGTIMLTEQMPPKFQGLAGSLVTVMVNYGTATFLGFAGVVEAQLTKLRPDDEWRSWRGALYFNIGISGLATSLAFLLVLNKFFFSRSNDFQHRVEHTDKNNEEQVGGAEEKKSYSDRDSVSALSV